MKNMETPVLLRRIFVVFAVLSLAACGGEPLTEQATTQPAQALPTAAQPSRETFAPPPTQPPAPTALPPTQPPAATAPSATQPPTQLPAATALPPTQPPAPTSAPATQLPAPAVT